jgi:hypothetical protein
LLTYHYLISPLHIGLSKAQIENMNEWMLQSAPKKSHHQPPLSPPLLSSPDSKGVLTFLHPAGYSADDRDGTNDTTKHSDTVKYRQEKYKERGEADTRHRNIKKKLESGYTTSTVSRVNSTVEVQASVDNKKHIHLYVF